MSLFRFRFSFIEGIWLWLTLLSKSQNTKLTKHSLNLLFISVFTDCCWEHSNHLCRLNFIVHFLQCIFLLVKKCMLTVLFYLSIVFSYLKKNDDDISIWSTLSQSCLASPNIIVYHRNHHPLRRTKVEVNCHTGQSGQMSCPEIPTATYFPVAIGNKQEVHGAIVGGVRKTTNKMILQKCSMEKEWPLQEKHRGVERRGREGKQ